MKPEPQNGVLDRIKVRRRNLTEGRETRIQRLAIRRDRRDQAPEIVEVDTLCFRVGGELELRVLPRTGIDLQLIKRLQRQSARKTARSMVCGAFGRAAALAAHGSRRRRRLAISSATSAASAPLLPALPPARSTACSTVSVVSTPNAIGTPDSSAMRAMPPAHSPAT